MGYAPSSSAAPSRCSPSHGPRWGPDWYRFAVAAAETGPLRAAGGITVEVDGYLDLLADAGTVIVPGWCGADDPVPASLCNALRAAHAAGARVLSLCSGAFVLAAAGLLDGKRATTHWRYFDALAARHPGLTMVPDVLYVDEGSVLTAAGSAAGLDLCLHLIRRDWGPRVANQVARRLVVPPHRDGGQAQYVDRPVPRERAAGSRLAFAGWPYLAVQFDAKGNFLKASAIPDGVDPQAHIESLGDTIQASR